MAHLVTPDDPTALALIGLGADLTTATKAADSEGTYQLLIRRALQNYENGLFRAGIAPDGITKIANTEDMVTKAVNPQIAELTARLDRIEKMAAPGGPALRRPQASPEPDPREQLADQYRHQATQITDPVLARGYRDRAAQIAKGDTG